MNSADGAQCVIEALNRLEIPYMVVGSFSSNIYGVVRATLDADFVVQTDDKLGDLRDALRPDFRMESQIRFETRLMTTKYLFHQDATDFKVEVFVLSDDPHDQERFRRRLRVEKGGTAIYFPTAEDIVIQKVRWGRKKDINDVRDVLKVRGDRLDWDYIHAWCERHGTRGLLDEICGDSRGG